METRNYEAMDLFQNKPELSDWLHENKGPVEAYSKLQSENDSPMLFAPDAIRRGISYDKIDPNIWVTKPISTEKNLNFLVGNITIAQFPKVPVYPGDIVFALKDLADKDPNIPTASLIDVGIRNPFGEDEFTRWFSLGSNAFEIAKGSNLDEQTMAKLATIHLGSFIWGAIGFEKYFKSQLQYVRSGNLTEMMNRVYPGRESSQLPFGNCKQLN